MMMSHCVRLKLLGVEEDMARSGGECFTHTYYFRQAFFLGGKIGWEHRQTADLPHRKGWNPRAEWESSTKEFPRPSAVAAAPPVCLRAERILGKLGP